MRRRFVTGLTCLMLAATLLGGCRQKTDLDSTSVYIRKDGSVSSAVYEAFDTDTYNKDELQKFVEDAVSAYNQTNAGVAAAYTKDTDQALSAAIRSLDVKGGEAVLKMEYASCKDYVQFNESEGSITQMASGTVKGAKEAGIDLSQFELLNPEGSDKITANQAQKDASVLFVQGKASITVEGKVEYASAAVNVTGKITVEVDSADALSCIVFK